jgi:dCTP deaminase
VTDLEQPGVFPAQALRRMIDGGWVRRVEGPFEPDQIQPASLDLSLSEEAYAVPGSMLPLAGESVRTLARRYARRHIDLAQPQVLVRGEVYVVRLNESLALPDRCQGYANSKSSTGRIDLQTRLLTDGNPRYDKVHPGYRGELWLELIPKSFDVEVQAGTRLNQIIFFADRALLSGQALEAAHAEGPLLYGPDGNPAPRVTSGAAPSSTEGLLMTLNLDQPVVGYVAKKSFRPVSLVGGELLDPRDFFEPIRRPREGALFLSREAFYILCTWEFVAVPPTCAVEMLPYDMCAGEFRAHYAGFFDPGFGHGPQVRGTPAVLEVRPYEDDLIVRHRQPVCRMAYERLQELPDRTYGAGNHYAHQRGPKLSRVFRGFE